MNIRNFAVSLGVLPFTRKHESWVFARTACLGTDTLNLIKRDYELPEIYNFQKARIEYLTEALNSFAPPISKKLILWARLRKLIVPSILPTVSMSMSEKFLQKALPPEFIVLDDFAELTDQKFTYQSIQWYSHYGDLSEFAKNSSECQSHGLLQIDEIQKLYEDFFKAIFLKWPQVQVIFMLFPIHRENRPEFMARSQIITETLHHISLLYPRVHIISAAEKNFPGAESITDPFPYHYQDEVYKYFAERVRNLIR